MKLKLKNIREHALKELNLPETGLVRVHGESGTGKSSVLDALSFALYDNRRGLRSFDRSGCLVELDGFGLALRRSKGPARLEVNGFDGEPAQGEVERVLGMSESEFMVSSYVVQDLYGSLLTLSPTEQLHLIQRLASGADDPEVVKLKIRRQITCRERAVESAEGQGAMLAGMIADQEAKLAAARAAIGERGVDASELADLERAAADARAAAQHLKDQVARNDALLAHPYYGLDDRIRQAEQRLADLAATATPPKSEARPWPELSAESTRARLTELAGLLARAAERDRHWERIRDVALKHDMEPTSGSETLAALESLAASTERELDAAGNSLAAAKAKLDHLELASHVQDCPECRTPLVMVDGRLVKSGTTPADLVHQKSVLTREARRIEATARALRQAERDLATELAVVRSALAQLGALAVGSDVATAHLRAEEAALLSYQKTQLRIEQSWTRHERERARVQGETAARREELARLVAQRAEGAALPARQTLVDDASRLRDELVARNVAAARAETAADAARVAHKRGHDVHKLEATLETLRARLPLLKEQERVASAELSASMRLRELSDRAATQAVGAILSTINVNAQRYLEVLFPDAGTSVILRNERQIASGERRARLALEIFHKGHRYDGLRDLSGGERSRVCLAFQLALSEMYRSPLLMVDEGMKGLSPDLKMLCLDALREIASDKLVLVVEHGAPDSAFDAVIDLDAESAAAKLSVVRDLEPAHHASP